MPRFLSRLQRHDWATPTVLLAVVVVMAASVARAFTTDPLGSADEPAHIDYALQVWHGHLPRFADGLRYTAPFGAHPPVQWVAQHPPLFYLVLAPVVGPAWDAGHLVLATMLGRMVSVVAAGALVLACAWAASRAFPAMRRLPSAVAVVTALTGIVVVQGGSIYNDAFYAVLCALAGGVAASAIRRGVGPRLLVAGALVGAAGMTTRLSFGIWLAAVVVGFALAHRTRLGRLRGAAARVVAALVPLVAAGAASGWFWVRNHELTGSFSGRPTTWTGHVPREKRTDLQVVTDPDYWRGIFGAFRGALDPLTATPWLLLLVPVFLAAVAVLLHAVLRGRRRPSSDGFVPAALVVAMFAIVTLLFTIVEIRYVAGGGGTINRYVLTVQLPIALLVAGGLAAWGRASWVLLTVWSAVALVPYRSLVVLGGLPSVPGADLVAGTAFVVSLVALAVALLAVAVPDLRRGRGRRVGGPAQRRASRSTAR
ncbi:hypothetical protein DEJ13_11645 [Curtobacterium sp. MCLR17_007]|uniref:hypothetical protein n=1 Tax=Curtobacterium sp. MCLR17_007 TaxID=2175648 RepID=UPI000DAAB179|nr:hypothetical protein [Curtobacterium sp. MCLR17_007]WIB59109.1 hypothetical protein DEJ13_11645 [Curtobacterium sp. MCLR17_007]